MQYSLAIEAVRALNEFNPPGIKWKAQYRLDRNLRKLSNAAGEFEFLRDRLQWSAKKDQSKSSHKPDGSADLTPEEHLIFSDKLRKLFDEEVVVEIQPVVVLDSEQGQEPIGEELFIDLAELRAAKYPLSRSVRSILFEAGVFTEPGKKG